MEIVIYLTLTALFAFVLSVTFPYAYLIQKRKVIECSNELINIKETTDDVNNNPVLALAVISISAFIYYLSTDVILFIFCSCLAIAAYCDGCKRWIPDLNIYLLLGVSVYTLHDKDLILSLFSVIFYLMPVALLSLYGFIKKKESWIATGDYYVFPSIGLMLIPEYAAGVMLATLALMLVLMRWVNQVPLITVAFFTYTGFNVCLYSGLL